MAANLLTLRFRDWQGKEGSFSCYIDSTVAAGSASLQAMIEAWVAMSDATLVDARLSQVIDISGFANPAAVGSDSEALVQSQAQLQFDKTTGPGTVRLTVPAPKDGIFDAAGAFANVDVDETNALVAQFLSDALAYVGAINQLRSGDEDIVTYDKGWRKGYKHS